MGRLQRAAVLVAVRGSFVAMWLERRIFDDITRALEAVAAEGTAVRFEAGELVIEEPKMKRRSGHERGTNPALLRGR